MSHQRRPLVQNAADPKQVRRAGRKVQEREERLGLALRAVLETVDGRIVFWDLLERAGLYRSIWDPSARIHFLEGRRNFGLEIQALCLAADEELYLKMEAEGRRQARLEDQETRAAQTPPAHGEGHNGNDSSSE